MNNLYHHGIKGQRWGVRRFQNKDGTLTAKGKKRYGDNETNSVDDKKVEVSRKSKITEKDLRDYRNEMISRHEKNAEKSEFYKNASPDELRNDIHRKQMMKKVAVGVAVTAGVGVGIYFAYKHNSVKQIQDLVENTKDDSSIMDGAKKIMKNNLDDTDIVLSKDSILHRMTAYKDIDFSKVTEPTYVAYKEKDVLTYMTQLKDWSGTGERYDVSLKAITDIRMPSREKAKKIFEELWNDDPTYRKKLTDTITTSYRDLMAKQYYGKNFDDIQEGLLTDSIKRDIMARARQGASQMISDDPFKAAIYSIVRREEDSKQLITRFAEKGYNALEDYFDKGVMADNPVILFNPSSSVVKVGEQFVTEAMKKAAAMKLSTL